MKVKVRNTITSEQQSGRIIDSLRTEWVKKAKENLFHNFKKPSREVIDSLRADFPLVTLVAIGIIVTWQTGGEHEDFGPVAVVLTIDGLFIEANPSQLEEIKNV